MRNLVLFARSREVYAGNPLVMAVLSWILSPLRVALFVLVSPPAAQALRNHTESTSDYVRYWVLP